MSDAVTTASLVQPMITPAAIVEMVARRPRRYRVAESSPLREPTVAGRDHRLNFRFRETFANLLASCPAAHADIRDGDRDEIYTYLKCDERGIVAVRAWLASMESLVVCRDLLAVSMAIDYDREGGDPDRPSTLVASQRKVAKPYDRAPTDASYAAANHIAAMMVDVLERVPLYGLADTVVAVPPSASTKAYDLPALLAQQLAARTGRRDGTASVRTVGVRPQLKNLTLEGKLAALDGTVAVDPAVVAGRTILLVDDLYQSGVSMNFVAMKLQQAGARAILGLAAEKTCRNDANVTRP